VQEEHKRFILVRAEECPTSSEGGESCIILHQSAYSRGYKRVREGGTSRSQDVSEECVSVCVSIDLPSVCSSSSFFPLGMVPTLPFYRCRGMQGYMIFF
jgi:hypothetical protein